MQVFIGVDPHKLSATIEVVDARETVLAVGRFDTNKTGYADMGKRVAAWPDRVWAVEGSGGAGRPLAQTEGSRNGTAKRLDLMANCSSRRMASECRGLRLTSAAVDAV